ncbi:hypothetical protein ElyMa_001149100 [Elysia marginata]|uniref:Secreted protein n=1 Tax=Elysia marginata TaxID=1093978 RepID=A0AAV4HYR6_9GAST|nr:hypothetical protein ElyMa_001149100 [Elysia marginata]
MPRRVSHVVLVVSPCAHACRHGYCHLVLFKALWGQTKHINHEVCTPQAPPTHTSTRSVTCEVPAGTGDDRKLDRVTSLLGDTASSSARSPARRRRHHRHDVNLFV